uniref:Uncharacterized protein n=1 Tax=Geoglobus ahangari TaxID=113653 RepID=A0A7C4WE35_9EURY
MPRKRNKPELKSCVCAANIFRKLKENGPLTSHELKRGLKKFSEKSFYRALNCLKGLGLIREREDGKYELIERWQIFLDEEGYKIKLEHSKELLRRFIEQSDLLPPSESDFRNEYLLQHLKSGYPEIYSKYEEWQKNEEKTYYYIYKEEIEKLALKVKHGEPLKGYCELCPRVEIKKLAEHRES